VLRRWAVQFEAEMETGPSGNFVIHIDAETWDQAWDVAERLPDEWLRGEAPDAVGFEPNAIWSIE
jgi:hypothetical protein